MIGSDQSFWQKESWGYELSNDIRIVRNGPQFKKLLAKNAYSESTELLRPSVVVNQVSPIQCWPFQCEHAYKIYNILSVSMSLYRIMIISLFFSEVTDHGPTKRIISW